LIIIMEAIPMVYLWGRRDLRLEAREDAWWWTQAAAPREKVSVQVVAPRVKAPTHAEAGYAGGGADAWSVEACGRHGGRRQQRAPSRPAVAGEAAAVEAGRRGGRRRRRDLWRPPGAGERAASKGTRYVPVVAVEGGGVDLGRDRARGG
jgi:hypothetical protein